MHSITMILVSFKRHHKTKLPVKLSFAPPLCRTSQRTRFQVLRTTPAAFFNIKAMLTSRGAFDICFQAHCIRCLVRVGISCLGWVGKCSEILASTSYSSNPRVNKDMMMMSLEKLD